MASSTLVSPCSDAHYAERPPQRMILECLEPIKRVSPETIRRTSRLGGRFANDPGPSAVKAPLGSTGSRAQNVGSEHTSLGLARGYVSPPTFLMRG
jgi:hypothetical protein